MLHAYLTVESKIFILNKNAETKRLCSTISLFLRFITAILEARI